MDGRASPPDQGLPALVRTPGLVRTPRQQGASGRASVSHGEGTGGAWAAAPHAYTCIAWSITLGIMAELATTCLHQREQQACSSTATALMTTTSRAVFRRRITSPTVLRSMFVTRDMAAWLELHVPSRVAAVRQVPVDSNGSQVGTLLDSAHPMFHRPLTLRDSAGRAWPVVYEAILSSAQYHRRLSNWGAFCKYNGVRVGDTVEFRRCSAGEPDTLTVRVVRVVQR